MPKSRAPASGTAVALLCIALASCADRDGYGPATQTEPLRERAAAQQVSAAYFRPAAKRPADRVRGKWTRRRASAPPASAPMPSMSKAVAAPLPETTVISVPPANRPVRAVEAPAQTAPPPLRQQGAGGTERSTEYAILIVHAGQLLRDGEVVRARQLLESLRPGVDGMPALELARSYDPSFLRRLPSHDGIADQQRARMLYEDAIREGAEVAAVELKRLLELPGQALRQ